MILSRRQNPIRTWKPKVKVRDDIISWIQSIINILNTSLRDLMECSLTWDLLIILTACISRLILLLGLPIMFRPRIGIFVSKRPWRVFVPNLQMLCHISYVTPVELHKNEVAIWKKSIISNSVILCGKTAASNITFSS